MRHCEGAVPLHTFAFSTISEESHISRHWPLSFFASVILARTNSRLHGLTLHLHHKSICGMGIEILLRCGSLGLEVLQVGLFKKSLRSLARSFHCTPLTFHIVEMTYHSYIDFLSDASISGVQSMGPGVSNYN